MVILILQNADCSEKGVELSQALSAVFEPILLMGAKQGIFFDVIFYQSNKYILFRYLIANYTGIKHANLGNVDLIIADWSFKKLFGRQLGTSCPLATTSKVYVDITSNKVNIILSID